MVSLNTGASLVFDQLIRSTPSKGLFLWGFGSLPIWRYLLSMSGASGNSYFIVDEMAFEKLHEWRSLH